MKTHLKFEVCNTKVVNSTGKLVLNRKTLIRKVLRQKKIGLFRVPRPTLSQTPPTLTFLSLFKTKKKKRKVKKIWGKKDKKGTHATFYTTCCTLTLSQCLLSVLDRLQCIPTMIALFHTKIMLFKIKKLNKKRFSRPTDFFLPRNPKQTFFFA